MIKHVGMRKGMERTRLEAIVSRHRAQLVQLEQQAATVRETLVEAENQLRHVVNAEKKKNHRQGRSNIETASIPDLASCRTAGRALRDCKRVEKRGSEVDTACRQAAKMLAQCTKTKQRRRK